MASARNDRLSGPDRSDLLLRAAAIVIERDGIDSLTTTKVADQAGTAIGTVYRYFPDRFAVIEGVRERYRAALHQRFRQALASELPAWSAILETLHVVLIASYREALSFRAVTTHGWLAGDDRVLTLVDDHARRSLPLSDRHLPSSRVRHALVVLDALVRTAFALSPTGDPAVLRLALEHALTEIAEP